MSVSTEVDGVLHSGNPPREAFPLTRLASAYHLGPWRSVHWLTAGKNDHARVSTDHATFYLRRSHRQKSVESLRWQLDLLRFLRRRGLPVPRPVTNVEGDEVVVLGDRLYVATEALPGGPFDPAEPSHLRAAAHTLADYHRIVAGLAGPGSGADRQDLLQALEERLGAVDCSSAPALTALTRALAQELRAVWPALPTTVIHGGCRRGSLLFTGPRLTGVLDFDSARPAPRVLDLAIAVHDHGKVYTELGRDDHKVALDLGRVERFVAAYGEGNAITADEAHAVPLLLAAKRAQRALGRLARLQAGARLSAGDLDKIRLESARLAWLEGHRDELARCCAQAVRR